MIYKGDLLKINGVKIPKISSYKVGRNKLWKDADRNMNGDVRATLIGIFPKITIEIAPTTEDEMSQIVQLLDQAYFMVEFFDVRIHGTTTAQYYAGDFDPDLLSKHRGLYDKMTISLVPVSKRSY